MSMAVVLRSLSAAAAMVLSGETLPIPPGRQQRMLVCSYARVKCADDMEFV